MIIYLDYDGVLHPDGVYLQKGVPVLKGDQAHLGLFVWMPILETILADFPLVRVRLSTSWVYVKRFSYAKGRLSALLQARVDGSTFHTMMPDYEWEEMTRYEQILSDVNRKKYTNWLAIDNDDYGWPDSERHHLVKTENLLGLGDPSAQADLQAKLAILCLNN